MKITVIGGGNMGGAIVRGLVSRGCVNGSDVTVADPSDAVRAVFRDFDKDINLATNGAGAVVGADLVIVAVKPWLMESVCGEIAPALKPGQKVASIAAGVTFGQIEGWIGAGYTMFRIIPNTAIALGQSATFIASKNASPTQDQALAALFAPLGKVFGVSEEQMPAVTALASCGIAYALRYIDAAAHGGHELGLDYERSLEIVMQTVKGALALLETNATRPQAEIDKVTTPGGITLKGLDAMENLGFTDAVIGGLKASK